MKKSSLVELVRRKDSGYGTYDENTGGGEPIITGNPPVDRGAWAKHNYKEKRESGQPRTKDGKFTYNSVNGKEIKSVSLGKDGKSRGHTINPLLTGGVNGLDVKESRKAIENGTIGNDKTLQKVKDLYYPASGVYVGLDGKVRYTKEDVFDTFMRSMKADSKSANKVQDLKFEGLDADSVKKGRHTLDERKAIAKNKKAGNEFWVVDSATNKIKQFIKNNPNSPIAQLINKVSSNTTNNNNNSNINVKPWSPVSSNNNTNVSNPVPNNNTNNNQTSNINPNIQNKMAGVNYSKNSTQHVFNHSQQDIDSLRDKLKNTNDPKIQSLANLSDDMLDKLFDKFVTKK